MKMHIVKFVNSLYLNQGVIIWIYTVCPLELSVSGVECHRFKLLLGQPATCKLMGPSFESGKHKALKGEG